MNSWFVSYAAFGWLFLFRACHGGERALAAPPPACSARVLRNVELEQLQKTSGQALQLGAICPPVIRVMLG